MATFTHQCSIAFTVASDTPDGSDFTPDMLRNALLQRIIDLDNTSDNVAEWHEAVLIESTEEDE